MCPTQPPHREITAIAPPGILLADEGARVIRGQALSDFRVHGAHTWRDRAVRTQDRVRHDHPGIDQEFPDAVAERAAPSPALDFAGKRGCECANL